MEIAKEMCLWTPIQALLAIIIFIISSVRKIWLFRRLQRLTILGEQIVIRCIRLEYFGSRCESVYERLYSLFLNKSEGVIFNAFAVEQFNVYESTKAVAAITLSSRIFKKKNNDLTNEWDERRRTLNI